jgi:glycosyltransferase involved in cell wall biosynthesis
MYSLFNISFSLVQLIIIGCLLLAFVVQLFYYTGYYTKLLLYWNKTKKGKISFNTAFPSVSVIICAKNEAANLGKFLPSVLEQNYPSFEVIVVNDGSTDDSDDVLIVLKQKYPHLHTTFVPQAAKYIDSKKIALVLGIKAAQHEVLLFTDADCVPKSTDWIEKMIRNFDDETEIVLGYGSYRKEKGFLNHLIGYDTLFIAIQYLSFALAKKTYMGVGRNMAYKKSLFYRNKGFASHLNIQSGDDDLFICEASNKTNTKIEIHPNSITVSEPNKTLKGWLNQKQRHISTSKYYNWTSKLILGAEVLSRGLFYASLIALIVVMPHPITYIVAGSVFSVRYILQLIIINLTASHLVERKYISSIPLFDMLLPLFNLYLWCRSLIYRKQRYKWK